jgi:hypothetical protein
VKVDTDEMDAAAAESKASRSPGISKEKEDAIIEAFRHDRMI